MLSLEWLVARRYSFLHKKSGFVSVIAWFSLLGIALGVATLIVVMSVMNGFRHELFEGLVSMRGHVSVHGIGGLMHENHTILKTLRDIPGVKMVYPMLEQHAVVLSKGRAYGVVVQGLETQSITHRPIIQIAKDIHENAPLLSEKEIEDAFTQATVFIGRRLAEQLNAHVGDSIALLTSKSTSTAFGSLPGQKRFRIAGIFHVGMRDFDKSFVFMPLADAQHFFKANQAWSQIDIFSSHDALSIALTDLVQKVLDIHMNVKQNDNPHHETLKAYDWRHSDASIFHAVQMERNVMFLILTLIILIASFNIITGLTMLVKDKVKDIAILRTMGASRQSILKIFILTGSVIGVTGTIVGVFLGVLFATHIENIRQFLQHFTGADLFAEEIYFLSTLPCRMDMGEISAIIVMSLGLSFLATIYPAFKASKMDPVEGIK